MTKTLDWQNLQELRCPKCYDDLERNGIVYKCSCGYVITTVKLQELADDMITNERERQEFTELLEADN